MKQVWIASDGEQFDTEEECELHEMMPSHDVLNGMRLLGMDYRELSVSQKDKESWNRLARDAWYIRLNNAEAVKWLRKIGLYTNHIFPDKCGTFCCAEDTDEWVCIEDLLDELAKIRRKLTE